MKKSFLIIVAVLMAGDVAFARSYGVNFDGYYVRDALAFAPLPNNNAFGPAGAIQANWNNIHAPISVNGSNPGSTFQWTITDNKLANPISLSAKMVHQGGNDGGPYNGTSDLTALYSTGMRDNDGSITITTTVAPYPVYDLYIYYGNNPGTGFVLGSNYSKQTGRTGPLSFTIGALNGFSIVGPPDPRGIVLVVR